MRSHRFVALYLAFFASAVTLGSRTRPETRTDQSKDWPLHNAASDGASAVAVYRSSGVPQSGAAAAKQPVVVELFTSEGCSSCPPADSFVKKLVEQQPFPNVEIIALEEHVDYWNHDGWFDPFSSPEFTGRQQDYDSRLKSGGPYTPQMIIDGRTQLVGSHVQEAIAAIREAGSHPVAQLQLTPTGEANANSRTYQMSVEPKSAQGSASRVDLWIAVTEKGLRSNVNAGENAGHNLEHAPVVRYLHKQQSVTLPMASPVSFSVKPDKKWNPANLAVVALLAEPHSQQILGAGSCTVVP